VLDADGGKFCDREADQALFDAIKVRVRMRGGFSCMDDALPRCGGKQLVNLNPLPTHARARTHAHTQANVRADIAVHELDANINDVAFSQKAVTILLELIAKVCALPVCRLPAGLVCFSSFAEAGDDARAERQASGAEETDGGGVGRRASRACAHQAAAPRAAHHRSREDPRPAASERERGYHCPCESVLCVAARGH
jgi:hypothetical protein